MNRVNVYRIDDESGRRFDGYFDLDAATEIIKEDTRFDGNNNVSVHNIDRFAHQRLIRTARGRWVLDHWSQYEGDQGLVSYLTDDQARDWLLVNGDDEIVARYFGEQPDERGPGRPSIGGKLAPTDLGDELLARVETEATQDGTTRAATVRALLAEALDARERARATAADDDPYTPRRSAYETDGTPIDRSYDVDTLRAIAFRIGVEHRGMTKPDLIRALNARLNEPQPPTGAVG